MESESKEQKEWKRGTVGSIGAWNKAQKGSNEKEGRKKKGRESEREERKEKDELFYHRTQKVITNQTLMNKDEISWHRWTTNIKVHPRVDRESVETMLSGSFLLETSAGGLVALMIIEVDWLKIVSRLALHKNAICRVWAKKVKTFFIARGYRCTNKRKIKRIKRQSNYSSFFFLLICYLCFFLFIFLCSFLFICYHHHHLRTCLTMCFL